MWGRTTRQGFLLLGPICRHALQLAQAKSLREISDGLAVTCGKLSHLGLRAAPARSTLSYANAHRPWQLYQKTFLWKIIPYRATWV